MPLPQQNHLLAAVELTHLQGRQVVVLAQYQDLLVVAEVLAVLVEVQVLQAEDAVKI